MTLSERIVDAVAEELYKFHEWGIDTKGAYYENNTPWDSIGDGDQNSYRDMARAALSAVSPALDLMSSLAINPAIPYEFRAMMRSSLGEPPLSPWEAPLEGRRGKHRA